MLNLNLPFAVQTPGLKMSNARSSFCPVLAEPPTSSSCSWPSCTRRAFARSPCSTQPTGQWKVGRIGSASKSWSLKLNFETLKLNVHSLNDSREESLQKCSLFTFSMNCPFSSLQLTFLSLPITSEDFIVGFLAFIDYYKFENVHLFGASLGGFLAQKFVEAMNKYVASIILCNSFSDTSIFYRTDTAPMWVAKVSLFHS